MSPPFGVLADGIRCVAAVIADLRAQLQDKLERWDRHPPELSLADLVERSHRLEETTNELAEQVALVCLRLA